ncbi:MAG: DUF5025 domain-containing protein [Bacteroides sp.]|nr:DUF5025 domain-containing protein [Bacteroides sp.]
MKKLFIYATIVATVAMFSLTACDKEDNLPDNRPVMSYFRGTVNDEPIIYEQRDYWDDQIWNYSITTSGANPDSILNDSWRMRLFIGTADTLHIFPTLSPLHTGLYDITPVKDYGVMHNDIRAYIYSPKGEICYKLAEQNTFRIRVDSIYRDFCIPRIIGSMEGVLHNVDNPEDSLKINATFRVQNH